jgi:Hemerythrin HHE cation binding domain
MSTQMSMNKLIHAAIRRDLARFTGALASFPEGSKHRAVKLATAWKFFYLELDNHHRGEHNIAWPALRAVGVNQGVLDQMDAEHERLADALRRADGAFSALEKAPTKASADAAGEAVTALRDTIEEHFQHEEAEIESIYFAKRDTPEIKAMGRKFARRNPLRSGDFFAWLENGASPDERKALRESVPPPVVAVFNHVLGQRYHRIVAPVWR